MAKTDRRRFLGHLGLGAAGAVAGARLGNPAAGQPAGAPGAALADPSRSADLPALAERLRRAPRDDALRTALAMRDEGSGWRDLLGAAFLAGIDDVEPRPVGFKFHCVMMVSSAYQIGEAAPREDRLLPALYAVDDFKRSQARDARENDWELPALKRGEPLADPAAALRRAMDRWDGDAADRAVADLHASASLDGAFEVLWPYAARDFGNIGHKMIFAAQSYRTLQQIGWRLGEPVLRSLVYGILNGRPGQNDATFAPNRKLADEIRDGWTVGEVDPEASTALLAGMRGAAPDEAAGLIVRALADGRAPESLWDGLRLFALEILMRLPGLLAVHPLTTLNAFHYAFTASRNDGTRRLLLLQAASWSSSFWRFFAGRGMDRERPGIDALEAADNGGELRARNAFLAAADDRDRAARLGAAIAQKDGARGVAALASTARELLMRKVKEHHDYKYTAAVLEEIGHAHPSCRDRLAGAAFYYLRTASEDPGAFYRRAKPLLEG